MGIYDWIRVAISAAALIAYVVKYKFDVLAKVKAGLLELTTAAEQEYGSGTGELKKAYVVNLIVNSEFYTKLPFWAKTLISSEQIGKVIDVFVKQIFNAMRKNNKAFDELLENEVK